MPRPTIQGLFAGTGGGFYDSLDPDACIQVLHALVPTLDSVCILVIVGGALGVVLLLFMKREKLRLAD